MDCDVCIGGDYDGEGPEFFTSNNVKARKDHRCCECKEVISKGVVYENFAGKWDGDFSTNKTCLLCCEIRDVFTCHGSYAFGDLWYEMQESAFPRLTTASPCFTKLSAAAKQKTLDRWSKWKGLS